MARKVNKLSDLSIDEVSLVDTPANQHAKVVLSKRDEDTNHDGEVDKDMPDPSGVHVPGVEDEDTEDQDTKRRRKKEKDNEEEYEKGFFSSLVDKILTGDKTDDINKAGPQGMNLPYGQQQMGQPAPGPQNMMPGAAPQAFPAQQGQMPGQMQSGPPLPDEVVQYIQALEQQLAELQQTQQGQGQAQQNRGNQEGNDVNPFGKSDESLTNDEASFLQELAKNLEDEEHREAIAKAQELVTQANERAERAESIAKAERDHRLNEEYVSKARAFVNLPVSAMEFGPVLKRLHESMDDSDIEMIEKALSAANETIAAGGFFDEIGKGFSGGQFEPISKIDDQARALVEKSDGSLSMESARTQVIEQNPALYDEYLREAETRKG